MTVLRRDLVVGGDEGAVARGGLEAGPKGVDKVVMVDRDGDRGTVEVVKDDHKEEEDEA